ncbi:hypothetical protein K1719_013189 [Acacia pycnantha]|nr:hypothetical protein K1719_013189 [Acacia pycnantha]
MTRLRQPPPTKAEAATRTTTTVRTIATVMTSRTLYVDLLSFIPPFTPFVLRSHPIIFFNLHRLILLIFLDLVMMSMVISTIHRALRFSDL